VRAGYRIVGSVQTATKLLGLSFRLQVENARPVTSLGAERPFHNRLSTTWCSGHTLVKLAAAIHTNAC
jgi:hypothetical protein